MEEREQHFSAGKKRKILEKEKKDRPRKKERTGKIKMRISESVEEVSETIGGKNMFGQMRP